MGVYCKYTSYGRDTDSGISLGSSESISDPVDVDFTEEFSYDRDKNIFYFKDKEISPLEILSLVEKIHTKPTRVLVGFILRLRLTLWRKVFPFLIKVVDKFFTGVLWTISGEETTEDVLDRMMSGRTKTNLSYSDSSRPTTIQPNPTDFSGKGTIDFFGYKAKRWSVIVFCFLHLTLFFFSFTYQYKPLVLKTLFENNFLTLCYIVVTFAIFEHTIPDFLKICINKYIPKIFGKVMFKRIKVG